MMAEQGHGQYASQSRATQNHRRAPCRAPAASTGQHDRTYGEALGNLVQENRKENQPAQPVRYQKSRCDGNAVKEGMNDESEQHGISLVRMDEFVVMRLFAKMKMRCDRMLEEVDDQVAEKHQKRRRPAVKLKAFWNHLDQGGGQHEPRAQRNEVPQVAALPMPLHNNRSAENVGGSCGQAEKYAGGNGMHILIVLGAVYCFFAAAVCFCNSERNACSRSITYFLYPSESTYGFAPPAFNLAYFDSISK